MLRSTTHTNARLTTVSKMSTTFYVSTLDSVTLTESSDCCLQA